MCLSVPQIAVAATRISTSSAPGSGFGQSRTSVPSGPSRGFDLTTAIIGRRLYRDAPQVSPDVAEGRIDPMIDRGRRVEFELLRAQRKLRCELVDRPDEVVGIADEAVFVQSAVDDEELLVGLTRVVELMRHPAWDRFVGAAMDHEQRHVQMFEHVL